MQDAKAVRSCCFYDEDSLRTQGLGGNRPRENAAALGVSPPNFLVFTCDQRVVLAPQREPLLATVSSTAAGDQSSPALGQPAVQSVSAEDLEKHAPTAVAPLSNVLLAIGCVDG